MTAGKLVAGLLGSLLCGCVATSAEPVRAPAGGDAGAMDGKWTFTTDVNGSVKRRDCSFTQQGSGFSGPCKEDDDSVQVAGVVDGAQVSLRYGIDLFGQAVTVQCAGKRAGAEVTGALTVATLNGKCHLARPAAAVISAVADRKCRAYLGRTFEGATITRAKVIAATDAAPEMCVVRGEMPQDLDFEVRMPTDWNGRTVFIGGGGFDGAIGHEILSAIPVAAGQPAYATIATNHGHNANTMPGAMFGLDVEMLAEYAYLAVPRVMAPAKAVLRAQYGRDFEGGKVVYEGCSGGGRQALIQAQRYPDLFDGVISRAPASAFVPQFLYYRKLAKLQAAPGSALMPAKLEAMGAAVMKKCDALDGLQDGILGRPDVCEFDPAELSCKGAETETCLTPAQLVTARALYAPTSVLDGRYAWPGFPPGGEAAVHWNLLVAKSLIDGFARYVVAQDPNVDPLSVDPEKYQARLSYLSEVLDAVEPDLGPFKAHGGKLLLWTGQTDWLITANNATAYYRSVVEAMGGQASADEFIEYYTSPSVQHCGGGEGADRIDLVTPMFDWLEKGVAPSQHTIIATRAATGAKPLSRPLCRFPRYPKYVSGDPNAAESFTCALPEKGAKP